jgi:transposase
LDAIGKRLVNRSVGNDAAEVARVATRHGRPARVAIEACCGAADMAEELATTQDLPVELAHPGYVARLKRSPDKTDLGDAHLLADLVRVNYLPTVWLAPESTRQLRRLVRHRAQLVRRRKDVKLRIRGLLRENRLRCETAAPWRKAWLVWLADEAPLAESDRWILDDHLAELSSLAGRLAAVEAKIRAAVADDPLVAKLLKLAGVGLVTAVTMRAEIGRFDRFTTGKQLARFCGVTPRNASSGARQRPRGRRRDPSRRGARSGDRPRAAARRPPGAADGAAAALDAADTERRPASALHADLVAPGRPRRGARVHRLRGPRRAAPRRRRPALDAHGHRGARAVRRRAGGFRGDAA